MTNKEFKAARKELLFGLPKSQQRRIFGLLLGSSGKRPNDLIGEKERGQKPITSSDELIIAYLRLIRRLGGNILQVMDCVPELREASKIEADGSPTL